MINEEPCALSGSIWEWGGHRAPRRMAVGLVWEGGLPNTEMGGGLAGWVPVMSGTLTQPFYDSVDDEGGFCPRFEGLRGLKRL